MTIRPENGSVYVDECGMPYKVTHSTKQTITYMSQGKLGYMPIDDFVENMVTVEEYLESRLCL